MILIDTSVWVDFFRGADRAADLAALLEENQVVLHPWVLGELLLGGIGSRRNAAVSDLRRLPEAPSISNEEVAVLIQARNLAGKGIGWVDVHLLASALVGSYGLWSFDGRLCVVASELSLWVISDPAV